jgi:dTDP-4-amino-4,6-dideoxygalactose transaminase
LTPDPIPFVDLATDQAEIADELAAAIGRVVDSAWYLLGPELDAFEREFAAYCGVGHCVGVGSGMAALELALRALGIGRGDEVIVPAYTWVATWLAVSGVGAVPVPVDVCASTYNIDVEAARAALSERTAAVVPVHLRGEPADMDAVMDLARKRGIAVLEDAAQAHGATLGGRRVGGIGDAAAFSFYPAKNLGTFGDGGAITTDDGALAERLRMLRNYGMKNRYEVEMAGVNSRLAEIQAAVLRVKLDRLDSWNASRRALAAVYTEELADLPGLALPQPLAGTEPVYHLFCAGHAERDALRAHLERHEVETLVHYPLLPQVTGAYRDDPRIGAADLAVSDGLAREELSLPLHPHLREDQVRRVCALLREFA